MRVIDVAVQDSH